MTDSAAASCCHPQARLAHVERVGPGPEPRKRGDDAVAGESKFATATRAKSWRGDKRRRYPDSLRYRAQRRRPSAPGREGNATLQPSAQRPELRRAAAHATRRGRLRRRRGERAPTTGPPSHTPAVGASREARTRRGRGARRGRGSGAHEYAPSATSRQASCRGSGTRPSANPRKRLKLIFCELGQIWDRVDSGQNI